MGIYLNPGNDNFAGILKPGNIYVDKTMMLKTLNDFIARDNKYICVSRPRRFGKTMAQNMIAAFYSKGADSRELFRKLKIAQTDGWEENLNGFNVIQIDLNGEYESAVAAGIPDNTLNILIRNLMEEIREQFSQVRFEESDTLTGMLLRVYSETGEQFIILIDEYDVLVRNQVSEKLFGQYLSFLNSLFKNNTLSPAISLAYITGILPVVRDKIQSKLNNFREYTILDAKELAEYVGFTSSEVRRLCEEKKVDFDECRLWYDGYSQHGFDIYNPESVIESVTNGYFGSYWSATSSYAVVLDRLEENYEGMRDDVIRMLSGENIHVNVRRFKNTVTGFRNKDDAFTYLIHTGYLAYNLEDQTCRIPNNEIRNEWADAAEDDSDYRVTSGIIKASKKLLEETWKGDAEAVAQALDVSHIHVTSNRSYNNEDALGSAIYLAYIYALNEYTVVREMTAGKGFADVVYIPVKKKQYPAMIIELKRRSSSETALKQIRERRYFDSLSHYQGNLLFVGINYDEKDKTHECRIERFVKE